MKTRTVPVGEFKVRCLAIMDEVASKHEAVIITKRGKPVAKLVPVEKEKDDIYGFLKGKGKILGASFLPYSVLRSGAISIDSCGHSPRALAGLRRKPDLEEGEILD